MSAYEANSCTFILLACLDTKLTKKNALIIRNPDKDLTPIGLQTNGPLFALLSYNL